MRAGLAILLLLGVAMLSLRPRDPARDELSGGDLAAVRSDELSTATVWDSAQRTAARLWSDLSSWTGQAWQQSGWQRPVSLAATDEEQLGLDDFTALPPRSRRIADRQRRKEALHFLDEPDEPVIRTLSNRRADDSERVDPTDDNGLDPRDAPGEPRPWRAPRTPGGRLTHEGIMPVRAQAVSKANARTVSETSRWEAVAKSTEGRPIHTLTIGDGPQRVLVVAGLNGIDRVGYRWVEALARDLRDPARNKSTSSDEHTWMLVRAINPDGLSNERRTNARGIDLDQNFPTREFRPGPTSGRMPASEIETQTLLQLLYDFRPDGVVIVEATDGAGELHASRSADWLLADWPAAAGIERQPLDSSRMAGSLAVFVDEVLGKAVARVKLPIGDDWSTSWKRQQPRLMTVVNGLERKHRLAGKPDLGDGSSATRQGVADKPQAATSGGGVEPSTDWQPFGSLESDGNVDEDVISPQPAPRKKRRRGYEELPPSP